MTPASDPPRGAIFVHQFSRAGQLGPLAPWITMAGWAGAAERRYGSAWVATTEGVLSPATALALASSPAREADSVGGWRNRVPEPMITLAKDIRRVGRNHRFYRTIDVERWRSFDVPFVFQLHGLFCDGGLKVADALGVPSVLIVDACQVEEARGWGIARPGWAGLAERFGEWPQLRKADLVACVSKEVAESVMRNTGRRDAVEVVANGVDTELFSPGPEAASLRAELGLERAFVVGWAGSFRSFHGLDVLLDGAARVRADIPDLAVLLLGDGVERPSVAARAGALRLRVVLPGTVPYHAMPDHLRLMDVAVVPAPVGGSFHYSPLKLREYQAVGRPVVVSDAGEMGRDLHEEDGALLVPRGDSDALAGAIASLYHDRKRAEALGAAGRASVERSGSWDSRLAEVERLLPR
jgi:glycosyltransferase involved in cell wall biosynthesis